MVVEAINRFSRWLIVQQWAESDISGLRRWIQALFGLLRLGWAGRKEAEAEQASERASESTTTNPCVCTVAMTNGQAMSL